MKAYLQNLASDILRFQDKGITKVRFAKYIYFIHKELVKKNIVESQELKFIRMPLGPVPVGFMELHENDNILKTKSNTYLVYISEVYKLADGKSMTTGFSQNIKETVRKLDKYPTSMLVQISHKEPSWKSHVNGQEYYISNDDLKKSFPMSIKKIDSTLENDNLQASLVEGMIDDIVEESTSLEYPKK